MSKSISHIATVESVEQGSAVVRISQSSACASCQASRLCHSTESKDKLLTVSISNAHMLEKGQQVLLEGTARMGLKAVALAYVAPMVLLMSAVMVSVGFGASESVAALVGLVALIIYGIALWLMRSSLQGKFAFTVNPL